MLPLKLLFSSLLICFICLHAPDHSTHMVRGDVADSDLLLSCGSQRWNLGRRLDSQCLWHLTEWLCAFRNYVFPLTQMKENFLPQIQATRSYEHVEGCGEVCGLQTLEPCTRGRMKGGVWTADSGAMEGYGEVCRLQTLVPWKEVGRYADCRLWCTWHPFQTFSSFSPCTRIWEAQSPWIPRLSWN